jgi:class 3 adenylate cyclase
VVFADISGFTKTSERMDPEDVRAMVDRCMAKMGEIVARFGGTVDKVIGDALMAVFGAPVAHEDDAERAVRAALDLQACAAEHAADFGGNALRIGVNTGEVMFAPVGPAGRREFTVMGDVVNTASRLQSAAPRAGVLVGEATRAATARAIEYEEVTPVVAKGKEAPVRAWLALRAPGTASERPVSTAPMVGRDAELALLRRTWQRVVADARPHLVTVLGPPGIGKSRLTREFAAHVEAGGGRVVHGRCLPYGMTGYETFAQQVRRATGVPETDGPAEVLATLRAAARARVPDADAGDVADHVGVLMGLPGLPPVSDRQVLFFSARRFVEGLAREAPTVLVFEDIHWASSSLLDLVQFLATRVRHAPLLLLALARPELLDARPTWGGGIPSYTAMPLSPLTEAESLDLAASILHRRPSRSGVLEELGRAAGGNPLFLEELATAIDETSASTARALPKSVQAIIAARLDALPPRERAVLLDASVLGRYFWCGALDRLRGEEGGVCDLLDSLEAKDLVHREPSSRLEGDTEYSFKHMLVRDVAYGTLPKAVRRTLHAAAARYIEEAAGRRAFDSSTLLAHHWKEAGETGNAIGHLVAAAERAARAGARAETVNLLTEAIDLLPAADEARGRSLRLRRAIARIDATDHAAGAAEIDALLPGLSGRERCEALQARARAAYWLADAQGAQRHGEEAAALAEALGDEELLTRSRSFLAPVLGMLGKPGQGIESAEETLAAWPKDAPTLEGDRAWVLTELSLACYWTGRYERSVETARVARRVGTESHRIEGVVGGGSHLGMALAGLGRHEEAFRVFEETNRVARDVEMVPRLTGRLLNMWAGALAETGDVPGARRLNEEALELGRRASFPASQVSARIDLLFYDLLAGEVGRAEAAWGDLWRAAEATKGWHQWLWTGRLAIARAQIALATRGAAAAAEEATKAIAHAEGVGHLKYQAAARRLLAEALLGLRRPAEGLAEARRAVALAGRLGHPPSTWRAEETLARAFLAAGDEAQARATRARAAAAVAGFASGLSEPRRRSFLASAPLGNGATPS